MNFLAHIYLSGRNEEVIIGNFIADNVKGRSYLSFSRDIQTGILLHRAIDSFTDSHAIFKKSKKRLFQRYGHYSGVIVDILYDHFLAKNWSDYCDVDLETYVGDFYDILERHFDILPEAVQHLTPFMIADNWLVSYSTTDGIKKVLEGMNRRTKNRSKMNNAIDELAQFYREFNREFKEFFDELKSYSEEQLKILSSRDEL
ncbi:MAG: acyl carrier protein phosphodiesterase [Bacteroidia bacterium]|nr:acyl carrier protein phosphodiesterase [Bacteroidia bacterium]